LFTKPAPKVLGDAPVHIDETVFQGGVDYISFSSDQAAAVTFDGTKYVQLLPVEPIANDTVLWFDRGDIPDQSAIFDLNIAGDFFSNQVSITAWLPKDITSDLHLTGLSGNNDWVDFTLTSCNSVNDIENFAAAGWYNLVYSIDTQLDQISKLRLMPTAELLKFSPVVDEIIFGDISLFSETLNSNTTPWQLTGAILARNYTAQKFGVKMIVQKGDEINVVDVPLNDDNDAFITIPGDSDTTYTFVVAGLTPETQNAAAYNISVVSLESLLD
jgi:hypothetical protein